MTYTINGDDTVLDKDATIGTFAECLRHADTTGPFDHYRFCTASGRQVLLGHHDVAPIQPGQSVDMAQHNRAGGKTGRTVNTVFVTKHSYQPREASTWDELRELLDNDWVIGTKRYPGLKICFVDDGRNYRRTTERIYVF